ncbi:acetate kinase [Candidatus Aerophobetes bacterium]|nr:acetate kinase [Candidatus Aerophobetes bacterium]
MNILAINCGSSSIKYQFVQMKEKKEKVLAKGLIERIGKKSSFQIHFINGRTVQKKGEVKDHRKGLRKILELLTNKDNGVIKDISEISAVGHRVVHGGEKFVNSILIDDKVVEAIHIYTSLAPLHNPPNLTGIEISLSLLPNVPQVAVFDTAYHQTIPPRAFLYALPYEYYEKYKIRRYGFHGTSHRYVAQKAAEFLNLPIDDLRIITCHLGNGCSITAVNKGNSIDTTMGFTPLEGLVMGTRCGDIDPGVILFLMEKEKIGPKQMNNILNRQSGIMGISGVSNDIRDVKKEAQKGNEKAKIALEIFTYRIKKYIGAYSAVLGGIDVLVFTGGIGENATDIRGMICEGLEFLGIQLDKRKNNKNTQNEIRIISKKDSSVKVLVVPTDEEKIIAQETWRIVQKLATRK